MSMMNDEEDDISNNNCSSPATDSIIACFKHHNQRRMTRNTIQSDGMTRCYCIDHCKVRGYIYAGLKSGDTCSCGMSYTGLPKNGQFIETIISDPTVSYEGITAVLSYASDEVEDQDIIYAYTGGNWERDAGLGDASAISLQIMSEESENTVFAMAVGYEEKEKNTTILVSSQENGDDDSIINYMISGILHAVAYDLNGIVQKASLTFSMNTSKPSSIDNGKEVCAFLTDNGQLRKSERGILHLNLVVSLLAGQITFLLGIDKTENEFLFQKTCKFVAFLLHFIYLVVFAWMLLEAAYLYYKIISRAVTPVGIKVRYIGTGLAWGTPVIIAGLTIAVAKDGYIKTASCWLNHENGVVWTIAAPIIVILMVGSRSMKVRVSARGALILLPLLGLTWILGLFTIVSSAAIMQYMFVCCNSLQGAFIFINFCIVDKEVRTTLVGFFRKYVMKSKINTTNSSVITTSSSNNETQPTTSHT
ncbi:uncharacterized protein LOC117104996 [Anneissia japonica]|uniref:uncharacterized protein LOC117104996 n=1 Tax=Anneissia japonica TaxID=1529436 RepID=UPI001425A18E|nr:uncharacterized protein LOC117104996 [Anneissia japonica]